MGLITIQTFGSFQSQSQSLTRTCVADIDFARRVNGVTRRLVRGREPMSGGTLWVG